MFRWNCLSSSFTGGLHAKGAASFLFSVVLADAKVHHGGCLLCGGGGMGGGDHSGMSRGKNNHAEEQKDFTV